MTSTSFSRLNLPADQISNLDSLGYKHMTPIQAEALPFALNGEDLIAQAKTGSGKTAVFALAILAKLDLSSLHTQALILCPTRELCIQVATEIRRLARHRQNIKVTTLYGGQPISLQKQSLKHGTHIVVGTPGRIKDLMQKGSLPLDQVAILVLDEADRMLEMGFIVDMEFIINATPASRQTLLFSATFPENIQVLSSRFQRDPQRISVDAKHSLTDIRQHLYSCGKNDKLAALLKLLTHHKPTSSVIFCNFKQTTRDVCDYLVENGIHALALNGDMEQRDREEVLIRFKHQSCTVLVATDVAARGLDIKELPAVVNFELPHDPEVYVHRIGRTGRAGKTGMAFSLCTDHDRHKVNEINAYQKTALSLESIDKIPAPPHHAWKPDNVTFCISGGRKDKIRPGEILGALTGDGGIEGTDVGKIDILDYASYVAVKREASGPARQRLKNGKIKGRSFKIREL